MTVLITRPPEDAAPLAEQLQRLGYQTFQEPLLKLDLSRAKKQSVPVHQAILLTSGNGARALALATTERDKPVFAVGDSTASLARELGFTIVSSAGGDVSDLVELVCRNWQPEDGRLLHIAGKTVAGDLVGLLSGEGYNAIRAHMYDIRTPNKLSAELSGAFVRDEITAVLLFSPRTAKTFAELSAREKIGENLRNCFALCLSDAVKVAISSLNWRGICVAGSPTQDALIEALRTVCPSGQTD